MGNYISLGQYWNKKDSNDLHQKIKDLDIVMYIIPNCSWCDKMIDYLTKEGLIQYITVEDFKKNPITGITSFPTLVSKKSSAVSIGYVTIDKVLENFEKS
jgi:hypothetical protein